MVDCGCGTCICGKYDFGSNQNWIQIGEFPLHSGAVSQLKFELTKFTESDWESIAYLAGKSFKFQYVIGIPTGGMRLAQAMAKYATNDPEDPICIVDDVWTTGGSMRTEFQKIYEVLPLHKTLAAAVGIIGIVAIARSKPDPWVHSFLTMGEEWDV